MSGIQIEVDRIDSAKDAIATAIAGKGVTVPEGTLIDGMAPLIASIPEGAKVYTEVVVPNSLSDFSVTHNLGVIPYLAVACLGSISTEEDSSLDVSLSSWTVTSTVHGAAWGSKTYIRNVYMGSSVPNGGTMYTGEWLAINYDTAGSTAVATETTVTFYAGAQSFSTRLPYMVIVIG